MREEDQDIVFGSKEEYFTVGRSGGVITGRSESWRASIRRLLTNSDLVAHYTLREGEEAVDVKNAISSAGKLEGVDNRLRISSETPGDPQKTVVSYWIEPGTDLPEETPEQEAVDTSPDPTKRE